MYLLLRMVIFHCHVSFRGGNSPNQIFGSPFWVRRFPFSKPPPFQNAHEGGVFLRFSDVNIDCPNPRK